METQGNVTSRLPEVKVPAVWEEQAEQALSAGSGWATGVSGQGPSGPNCSSMINHHGVEERPIVRTIVHCARAQGQVTERPKKPLEIAYTA